MRALLLFTVRVTRERGGFPSHPSRVVPGRSRLLWSPVYKKTPQKPPAGDWTVSEKMDGYLCKQ